MNIKTELTVRNIDQTINEFIDEFATNGKVIVKSNLIEKIDLAGIQFLLALVKLSFSNQENIQLRIKVSHESRALMEKSGFYEIFNYILTK
jgi:hypothetical protein